ncbi:multicomponent Na+:H+ antiporter subunit A [Gracilibacillus halotolerans]|uniref:Multicomponent Na+:H+ antiporter subunit A n=1 Tax=Gracilibacillus halotolerans TaxID=74386 RepID=A0A841RHC1_9BACI|nr:Na+/H+ antiporter subunit A [Gracilibacillus halotolerans]MBB6511879.1 multicomponent Na+:H+ antiporter subunit A [Gracilibacillus halotolerans]
MLFTVFLPVLLAILIPFISKYKEKIHTGWFVMIAPLAVFIYYVRFIGVNFEPTIGQYNWIPSLNINFDFYLDGLSLLFVLLISGIGTLVTLYSIFYLHTSERLDQFYVYLLIFMTAMLGVVLSDNLFVLYSFWELTSISSFLLIGYWNSRERSRYGAQKSMMITVFGGLSMLGGFILLYLITGTTSIQAILGMTDIILQSEYFYLILALILLGAFTKSAQFPFHIWLPDAMEAPTPVSAYLHSATMVKAGIFLVARFTPIFSADEWFFLLVSGIGIVTLIWASYMAVRQTDLKGILAFSTISQLGMIMAMLGFGTEVAIFAAVFHILNHATFKGSLFMIAGIVDHETGTRDIRKLGGLVTLMPISATLAFFGTFSMAGFPLPFLNGFYSKELFFEATLELDRFTSSAAQFLAAAIPYLAVFGSIFTFIYSMYLVFGTFTGKKNLDQLPKKPHEAPIGMLLSPIILILGVILIGLVPNLVNAPLLAHVAEAVYGAPIEMDIYFWHGLVPAFYMSLIVVGVGFVLFYFKKYWVAIYQYLPGKLSLHKVYDFLMDQSEKFSAKVTKSYMSGSLRHYMLYILGAIVLITFPILLMTDGININFSNTSEITTHEVIIGAVIAIAAIATIFTHNKIATILTLGVVGYGLALLFILYRAPDLALTQLVVETISMALFLLCFYHLPNLRKRTEGVFSRSINLVISIGFGALITIIGLSAHSTKLFDKISDYFVETSYSLGGGTNIVNVILVDMRGIDTLFEVVVLGLAALGIFGLIKLRSKKGAE